MEPGRGLEDVELLNYPNVPGVIGAVVSSGKANLHELATVYGTEDLYDMLEIVAIDAHNRRLLAPKPDRG